MKIQEVETFIAHQWLIVRIQTDKGISGVGESTFFAHPEATEAVVHSFRDYLLGQDPSSIDHHWNFLYRSSSFRGAALGGALSAIDVALWDIAGKYYEVPVCNLLGGKHRDKVRMCALVLTDDVEELTKGLTIAVKEEGHTCVKIDPVPRGFQNMSLDRLSREVVSRVAVTRDIVGPDVDIGVEFHRKVGPPEAVMLAKQLEQFNPLFLEDPIMPDSVQSMARVVRDIRIPVATGERLHTIYEFRELLEAGAADHIKLDIGLSGGITHGKKICALAESWHAGVMPHNFLSPITTAAHVQLCAAIPNFMVLEYLPEHVPPRRDVVKQPLKVENGYITVPDTPGIGVEFDEEAPIKHAYTRRQFRTPQKDDGSIAYR